jgi:hypothetical protein
MDRHKVIKTAKSGSAKANGREPKTGLGRVFNSKSGCFDDEYLLIYINARPQL